MITQAEAIIEAFESLGREIPRSIKEVEDWVAEKYPGRWKDFGTRMADMVPSSEGGNQSSTVPEHMKVFIRTEKGIYRMR
ncbi:hypothetical protein SD71_01045 [Cohnella kolymensis]|uniref:Uncharacterized protein n=1 Tax=Cohnella kolymensis TaxID=1590652 RepID=A0ABR5A8Z9_9BACL|nr:hypothetical protein [Cohnella kolymensis]KIL37313.1 hypothetical protein SD71_01045 [Cohnella kolymensis]